MTSTPAPARAAMGSTAEVPLSTLITRVAPTSLALATLWSPKE